MGMSPIKKGVVFIAISAVGIGLICNKEVSASQKVSKTEKITVNKGETYKLKYKKKDKYKSSNKRIATVSQKGLIRAKKCGSCTIKLIRNKKVVSLYKVSIVNKNNINNAVLPSEQPVNIVGEILPTAAPVTSSAPAISEGCGLKDGGPGSRIPLRGLVLDSIEPIDCDTSYVYLTKDEQDDSSFLAWYEKQYGVVRMVVKVDNSEYQNHSTGDIIDNVLIVSGFDTEIKGDTLYCYSNKRIYLTFRNTNIPADAVTIPTPTPAPAVH